MEKSDTNCDGNPLIPEAWGWWAHAWDTLSPHKPAGKHFWDSDFISFFLNLHF